MSKKVLITGAGSYIGTSVEDWLKQWPDKYHVDTIDMKDGLWKKKNFCTYDVVFHVAGIAHADVGHVSEEKKRLYYQVNTELASEVAQKAKQDGVRQFIFMSSIIIYGDCAPVGKKKIIDKYTIPIPANFYGDSKLQAEKRISSLQDNSFYVAILRPPMVYGKGSKGNYSMLSKLARSMPIFPDIKNERSMIHIENLCEFIHQIIEQEEKGVFFPQNDEYVCTSQMVAIIRQLHGKKIWLSKFFVPLVWCCSKMPGKVGGMSNKAFGNFVYDKALSEYKINYRVNDLRASILKTEGEC